MGLCVPLVHVTIILLTKRSGCAQCIWVSASVLSALGSDLLCSVHGVRASVLSALGSDLLCSVHGGQSQYLGSEPVLSTLGLEPMCSVHWGQSQCAQHIEVGASAQHIGV